MYDSAIKQFLITVICISKHHDTSETIDFFDAAYKTKKMFFNHVIDIPNEPARLEHEAFQFNLKILTQLGDQL